MSAFRRAGLAVALGSAVWLTSATLPLSEALAADTPTEEDENGDDTALDEHAADVHDVDHHAFNLYYGLLGEGEADIEPTVLFRPKGMPVPFLALLINASILFGGLYWVGRKSMKEALEQRKQRIVQGMEEAAKMKRQAQEQLAMYEQKLKDIESEIERVRREMQAAAQAERANILTEAKARRERMERDAKQLIQQELDAAYDELRKDTVRGAIESATRILSERITGEDRGRIEREYLGSLSQQLHFTGGNRRGQA